MNATCAGDILGTLAGDFATVWVTSQEFRIAVFIIVLQCSFMLWAAAVVREIMRTSTTVLCKLLVYDSGSSIGPCTRTACTDQRCTTHMQHTVHKTEGGPPPCPPPNE
jgi:hypothetical protein